MSINKEQLKNEIISPALKAINMYSLNAVNLLLGTAAQESGLGYFLAQKGGGPAKGIFQMEPATHDDIVNNYLVYKSQLIETLNELGYLEFDSTRLKYDLRYATIFARLHYYRVSEKLPSTVEGMAKYWKDYYNTIKGKGTEEEFTDNYQRYVK